MPLSQRVVDVECRCNVARLSTQWQCVQRRIQLQPIRSSPAPRMRYLRRFESVGPMRPAVDAVPGS